MAAFFGGWPHELWHKPLHYYKATLREYLKIVGPAPDGGKTDKQEIAPGVTVETIPR